MEFRRRLAVLLLPAALAAAAAPPPAAAGTLTIFAYDDRGRLLDADGLLRYVAPLGKEKTGLTPGRSGLMLRGPGGAPAPGAPWIRQDGDKLLWTWSTEEPVRITLPWPVRKDGFSTVSLDGGGAGYAGEQAILLNEEIAASAYRGLQEAYKERTAVWKPSFKPTERVTRLLEEAKAAMADATRQNVQRKRAREFDEALQKVSFAWQQLVYEHGGQIARDPKLGARLRRGLSLDETVLDRPQDFEWIAEALADAGANWVRVVFRTNPEDFTYASRSSLAMYDALVDALRARKLHVMGSVLDSLLWPRGVDDKLYAERAHNLAQHFQEKIRSWEVSSEPNASWIGSARDPVPAETVLLCAAKGATAVKRVDPALETVAVLHWWDGTAPEARHSLWSWLDWALPRGFGAGIDVVGLSVYPHRHPFGVAFDPVFTELGRRFPGKKLMLGGWSYEEGDDDPQGYWWLSPKDPASARKDLAVLYTGSSPAAPRSLGGGFFWSTLDQMLRVEKHRGLPLLRVYKQTLQRIQTE